MELLWRVIVTLEPSVALEGSPSCIRIFNDMMSFETSRLQDLYYNRLSIDWVGITRGFRGCIMTLT